MNKRVAIPICLSLLVLVGLTFACVPAATPTPQVVKETVVVEKKVDAAAPLTFIAKKVAKVPVIDADASDPEWKDAPALKAGVLSMKAVYTLEELAVLMVWHDRDLSINSRGTWNSGADTGSWWQTGLKGTAWESFKGKRHPEWLDLSFDVSSDVKGEGCYAFCHEDPPGSGQFHHQTEKKSEFVDTWSPLAKHGFGPQYYEDMGWLLGVDGVTQTGPVVFDTADLMDPRQLLQGNITFVGYAEDKVFASPDDPTFAKRDRPRDKYCQECHTAMNVTGEPLKRDYTYPDAGEIGYYGNWNATHTAPLYMEIAPKDFADAMVLTQAEIDSGEAVAVKDLNKEQMDKYWVNYKAVNGVIPQLVLKKPTGSSADVRAAANWTNGVWTLELKRKLVTGYDDDVQFSDLTKDYYFGISLWNHTDLLSPLFREKGAALRFGK